jgi:drug/metabolite transporter (DMT)-like permease
MGVQEIISIHSVYALLLVITLGAVRGSVPAVSKVVVLSGLDPVLYAASISLLGGFLLLSINFIIGKITPLTIQVIRFSLIGGFVGITIPHIIFFNGIKTVDVGIASAMISGIPIMIYLLSLICKQEIFDSRRFAGVLFGLVGVAIIAGSEITRDSLLTSSVIGLTLILLSTIFYASNVVFIAIHLPKDFSRMQAAAWMMIFGSIPIWFYIIAFQDIIAFQEIEILSQPIQNRAFLFLLLHCCISGVAYYLSFNIISNHGPVTYSLAAYLMVAFGIFIGVFIFGENYTHSDLAGIVLVVLGVLIVTMKRNQTGTEPRLEPPQT